MTILDQPDLWKSIDPQAMYALLHSFPDQIQTAAAAGQKLSFLRSYDPRAIIVTGLGGSAIGGDLVKSIAGSDLKVPFIVNRDYALPGFVNATCLVFACSYSGNTEETISAYQQARQANATIVCITSGGKLEEMGKADAFPVLKLPPGLPPRAALGHSLMTLFYALQKMQIIPDMGSAVSETIDLLFKLRDRFAHDNPEIKNGAKILASSLKNKIVALYGSSGIMEAVAFRWRSQIEENAKNLAFHHVLPEMNHNELVGWLYPVETLRQIGVILLRDKGDHPQVQRRFDLVRELISGKAGVVHEIWSEGESLTARVMSSLYLGDYVSLYLAYVNNVDPTPVEVINYLKKALADPK
jgi:glucose/mannose-6-phosphate isomerase